MRHESCQHSVKRVVSFVVARTRYMTLHMCLCARTLVWAVWYRFALRVSVTAYPERVSAVWIMLAVVFAKLQDD
jgi:hypothetical protein